MQNVVWLFQFSIKVIIIIIVNVPLRVPYRIYCMRGGARGKYGTQLHLVLHLPLSHVPGAINLVWHKKKQYINWFIVQNS